MGASKLLGKCNGISNEYEIREDSEGKFVKMFVGDDNEQSFTFNMEDLKKIRDNVWFISGIDIKKYVYYIEGSQIILLHTYLTGLIDIEYIDLNKLNNRRHNYSHINIKETTSSSQDMLTLASDPGHFVSMGKCSGQYRNRFDICTDSNGINIVRMFAEPSGFFIFLLDHLDTVTTLRTSSGSNRATWYTNKVATTTDKKRNLNYVRCTIDKKAYYLHAYLMEHQFNGKGANSVDHIDQDPMNNMISNLRIATQSEQNKNRKKKCSPYNAQSLPDGITYDMLPKFVTYTREVEDSVLGYRDCFRIEYKIVGVVKKKQISSPKAMTYAACLKVAREHNVEEDGLDEEESATKLIKLKLRIILKVLDHLNLEKDRPSMEEVDKILENINYSQNKPVKYPEGCRHKNCLEPGQLPENLVESEVSEFLIYYRQKYKNDQGYREYFKIKGHPAQPIKGKKATKDLTKSIKLTIREKLEIANEELAKLDLML